MVTDQPPSRQIMNPMSSRGTSSAATATLPKRVLLITYPFPPVGGAGVQRVTKFVKYLPHHGWSPSVLTVSNPSVPVWDHSLASDVPADVLVYRARSLEPGYGMKRAVSSSAALPGRSSIIGRGIVRDVARGFAKAVLQPDPQILWMPAAVLEGKRLLRRFSYRAIIASGPPFSTFLIGARLSRHSGLPLVLDYRDEWDLSNNYLENKRHGRFFRKLQSRMQLHVLRAASALVATTENSASVLARLSEQVRVSSRVTWIYNGFDPEDFENATPYQNFHRDTYRLAYVGTLWNLTSVAPLISAVEELMRRDPAAAARLELIFAGRRSAEQQVLIDKLGALSCKVVQHSYLDHREAIGLLRSADGLCVLLSNLPGAERVVPAKIFEYMAAGKSIIGIGPAGEMCRILSKYPAASLHRPSEVNQIADALQREVGRIDSSRPLDLSGWDASAFDRRSEAGQLAKLLDDLT